MKMSDVEATFNAAGIPFTWPDQSEVVALGCHVRVDGGNVVVIAADPEGEVQRIEEVLGLR